MSVLNASNVVKIYKGLGKSNSTKALNGIYITIENGEFVAIMGPSGSGKTTLLNILSGIDKLTSGDIEISGQNINIMTKDELALFRRRHLGFVFQEFNLLDSLTLKENVMLPMILDDKEPEDIQIKADEVMAMFNIEDIMGKYPYTVSGGQQQRTAISRAIINNPDIIFADEPTGNLDSKSSKNVMKCFEKLNTINKNTVLIVTHDSFAASYCNRVIFIKDGIVNMEIRKDGTKKEFFDNILGCLALIGGAEDDF
ncbi:ABC transporter ATP-binding protein [Clostridium estertheticum]|uniref:ABC transporter ATP-binding protein n=1 Tax=Clostridium estertheticum TaxID=238834 RepID=UPI001C0B6B61|nr:ABC transporter ATP-binding protein [Clostridium estertheticum]MBU3184740.1 ABC transporter ATP-binding protein [Clostridium estertheticum]